MINYNLVKLAIRAATFYEGRFSLTFPHFPDWFFQFSLTLSELNWRFSLLCHFKKKNITLTLFKSSSFSENFLIFIGHSKLPDFSRFFRFSRKWKHKQSGTGKWARESESLVSDRETVSLIFNKVQKFTNK